MLENDPLCTGVTHTLNHGRMVHNIREIDAPGELGAQSSEGGIVGDVARREDERGGLAVEGSKLSLEGEVHAGVTGDVPGATGTVAVSV